MRRVVVGLMAIWGGWAVAANAGDVEILMVELERQEDRWTVHTTLHHADTGWEHYADAWRLVDGRGTVLGTRTLFHPHVEEQPFTRSLSGVRIPATTRKIFVEAHDKVHGWASRKVAIDLGQPKGERYTIR